MANTTTTTTTTGLPTTTTTTTTKSPLSVVQTVFYRLVNGSFVSSEISNASNSTGTTGNLFASSFDFGTLAPGQTSSPIVISLNIPNVKGIANVRIAITEVGGIDFAQNMFGVTYSPELRDDIIPDAYFTGLNIPVVIPNKDNYNSSFVYLSMKISRNTSISHGIIRYRWYFDYDD